MCVVVKFMNRRELLKVTGSGVLAAQLAGSAPGQPTDGSGLAYQENDSANVRKTSGQGAGQQACPIPNCIHPVLGYSGLDSTDNLPAPLRPDHEVELLVEFVPGRELPEFIFQPTGLFVESGDVVQFTFEAPEHSVTAYHPAQGRQRRVPEGVPPFTSPILTGGDFWLYRFDKTVDFGEPGETARPPVLTSGLVLNDPALAPRRIKRKGTVDWEEVSERSKQELVEINQPLGPTTLVEFDPNPQFEPDLDGAPTGPELPENIAVDGDGAVYVSMALTGEIRKVASDGTQTSIARLDLGPVGEDDLQVLVGLAIDGSGNLWAALASFDEDTHGIWRVAADGSEMTREVALPLDVFPNGVAIRDDDVYFTDSAGGAVWKLGSGPLELVSDDELLDPLPPADLPPGGFAVGANGLAFGRDGSLYVANTNFGRIVRLPLSFEGEAGTAETWIEHDDLVGIDGIAFDVEGRLYAAVNAQNSVVRVTPGDPPTHETVLVPDDGLDFPSDVHFGTTPETLKTVFLTNFAVGTFLSGEGTPKPSLMAFNVDEPGLPECL